MTKCTSCAKYKATRQPKCNCHACWDLWFTTHKAMTAAIYGMVTRGVKSADLAKVLGSKALKQFNRFLWADLEGK